MRGKPFHDRSNQSDYGLLMSTLRKRRLDRLNRILRSRDLNSWQNQLSSLKELYPKQSTNWDFYQKALSRENEGMEGEASRNNRTE
ncbi:hypothetical protein D5R40_34635, partial [Okeania hirsuta]